MFLSATAVGSIIFGTLEQLNLFQRTPRPPLTFGFNLLGYGLLIWYKSLFIFLFRF